MSLASNLSLLTTGAAVPVSGEIQIPKDHLMRRVFLPNFDQAYATESSTEKKLGYHCEAVRFREEDMLKTHDGARHR